MHLAKRLVAISAMLAAVLLFTACPQQTTISKINADPGRYRNKEVGIAGTVKDSYGVLGNGAYEIDDGTGRIWVVTTRGVPSRGSRVGTKGKVYTGYSFGGRSFGTVLGWPLLMGAIIIASNTAGYMTNEWRGVGSRVTALLGSGMAILFLALWILALAQQA